jgi:hypothetical protein
MIPSLRVRVLISILVAVVSGLACWWYLNHFNHGWGLGDFAWAYWSGRDLLEGRDPYRHQPNDEWIPYPLPAAIIGLLFAPLPISIAGAFFFALSSGLLAFGLSRTGYTPLMAFLAAPYWLSLTWAQWTPLIVASAFFPIIGAVLVIKPHIAAPVVLSRLSRGMIVSSIALLLVSFVIDPSWPFKWIRQLGEFQRYFAILSLPFGPFLLLTLKRRHDPDAQLLLLASIFPQRWLYDAFILWLIPKSRKEFLYTALASWVAWVWRVFHMPRSTFELGLMCTLCFYSPMLVIVLKRPINSFAKRETSASNLASRV